MLSSTSLLLLASSHQARADFDWDFPPVSVSSSVGQDVSDLSVGISTDGTTIALWLDPTGLVQTSSASFGGSWSMPETLSGSGASSPKLFVDLAGNAVAIWIEGSMVNASTFSTMGMAWSSPEVISSSGATQPVIAGDTDGSVVAVWERSGAIESSTLLFGGSWPMSPDTLSSSDSSNPAVYVSTNGQVVAGWTQVVSGNKLIFVIEKAIDSTWGSSESLSDPDKNSDYVSVAIGRGEVGNNAIAAWFSYDIIGMDYFDVIVYASIQDLDGEWHPAEALSTASLMDPAKLHIVTSAVDDGGIGIVWTQSTDGSLFTLEGGVFPRSMPFQQAPGSDPNTMLYSFGTPTIPRGMLLIVGMKRDEGLSELTVSSVTSLYQSGFYVGSETGLSSDGDNYFPFGALAQDTGTNITYAAVGWLNYDGMNTSVQILQGSLDPIDPPENLGLMVQTITNAIFTDTAYALTWDPSPSFEVNYYNVYRNGTLVFQDFNSELQFVDHNRLIGETVVYAVTAFSFDGRESLPITISNP